MKSFEKFIKVTLDWYKKNRSKYKFDSQKYSV